MRRIELRALSIVCGLAVCVPLLAFGPAERTTPTRWALIVGIGDYVHFDDVDGGDLPGAERDARAWRDVLVARWGFPEENVRVLLSREATRAAIEEAFREWAPSVMRPGDQFTFVFSGHGSQVWDENGDEDDGLDETIAPADVDPSSPELDITDDELGEWLAELPTRNQVVFQDNCHSGTGTRAATPFHRTRKLGREVDALPVPEGTPRRRAAGDAVDESGFDAGRGYALELAAAQPHQTAVDAYFPGEGAEEAFHGGAFSTFFIRQLWRADPSSSYEDVYRRVQEDLRQHRFQQDPFLSEEVGRRLRPLFWLEGEEGEAASTALPVVSVRGSEVEVMGGQALGVTTGSVLESGSGARLRVDEVRPDRSVTSLLRGRVAEGDRVRLIGYRFPTTPLRVNVGGLSTATADALREAFDGSGSVRLVEDPDDYADLLLRRRGDQVVVIGADGSERSRVMTDASGRALLVRILRGEAAATRLGSMENPSQPFDVELRLSGAEDGLSIGENIRIEVRSAREGYLTLVDLGTNDSITVLYPNRIEPGPVRVEAGEWVSFPSDAMGFDIEVQPPPGRGMVRAWITEEPVDVPLSDDAVTGGDDLLAEAVAGAVREGVGGVEGAPEAVRLDSWGSAALFYEIRP